MQSAVLDKILGRKARVAVVGQGYVGLPLAVSVVEAGYPTFGIDIDSQRVRQLTMAESYVLDVSNADLKRALETGLFFPTTDFGVLEDCDVVIICVPTPLRKAKDPDISYIVAAMDEIKTRLHKDLLIILESTTYPGTTDELIASEVEARGMVVGRDVYVCFSPERVDPGNRTYKTRNTPKVIGGVTQECGEIGAAFYGQVMEHVVRVSSAKIAEMAKLLENTFRAVNIGLVNELALMCERLGIDIWEVIDAAATKPFGFMPFYPGPGIGGHCIPLDPMYLSWKARMFDFYNRFIDLASDINGNMPRHVVERIAELLNDVGKPIKGSKILVLGLAYKKDVDDLRESPSVEVFKLLRFRGALVSFHDPLVDSFTESGQVHKSVTLSADELQSYDCVVLTTDHTIFDYPWIAQHAKLILDTRNAFKGVPGSHIARLGAPTPQGLTSAQA